MKRDFADLTPQEALHVAIFIEERNASLYAQFAELFAEFKDPDSLEVAQAFWEMAEEERRHGTYLQDRYFERYGTRACVVTEEDVRDMIELPQLETSNILAVARSNTSLSPRRNALKVALEAEQTAQRFYSRLAETTPDRHLRAIYAELAEFETDHTSFLQKKISEAERAVGESGES